MSATLRSLAAALVLLGACRPAPDDTGDTADTSDTGDTADTNDTDTGTDTDTADTDTGSSGTDCHVLPSGGDPFLGGIPNPPGVTTTAYSNDVGLDDLVAIANGTMTMPAEGVTVSNVTVTQIGYAPVGGELWSVWFADGQAAMRTYLQYADVGIPVNANPVPGDVVSFKVTEIDTYMGEIEITELEDWAKAGTTEAVYVRESTGAALSYATDGRYVHHVWGELTTDPVACPEDSTTRRCFDLTHGGADGEVLTFRVNNVNLTIPLEKGDCVELYAPLSTFDGDLRFDVDDYDWFRWFGNSGAGN